MANKFKKNDKVKVICGKDKGKISTILLSIPRNNKVLLSEVNVVKRHMKPSKNNPEGGIVLKEMPIHVSNITHIDPSTNLASKIGFKIDGSGKKVRFYKKSGALIDNTDIKEN